MESVLKLSAISFPVASPNHHHHHRQIRKASSPILSTRKCNAVPLNGSVNTSASSTDGPTSMRDAHNQKSSLESLFCYDKAIPEEVIEEPVGLALANKEIGERPRCSKCQTKGAVLCPTCTGSGLYVDAILESQGIIVKVRCLGCGGTGNIMCTECGGRGHAGHH